MEKQPADLSPLSDKPSNPSSGDVSLSKCQVHDAVTPAVAKDGSRDEKKFLANAPYHTASLFSKLTFSWIGSWIHNAYKCKNLTPSHLYPNIPQADAALLNKRYEQYVYNCKISKQSLSITGMISNLFFWEYVQICTFQMMETMFKISGCYVTIQFCQAIGKNIAHALIYGLTSAAMLIVNSAMHHQVFFSSAKMGMLVKITLNGAIYQKLMKLTIANDSAAGQIVNMVSNDVQKIEDYCTFQHFLWFSVVETLIVCAVVGFMTNSWQLALILFGFVVALALFQVLLSFRFTRIRTKMVATRDEMIRYVTDLFTGMQVIKYYAWEEPFLQKISTIRSKVNHYLDQSALLKALNSILYYVSNDFITCILILFLISSGTGSSFSTLTAVQLMGARQLFSVVVLVVCCFLPRAIELRSEAQVSIRRIEEFMKKTDIEIRDEVGDPSILNEGQYELVMKKASFNWPGEEFLLENRSTVSLEDDSVPDDSPIALRNLNVSLSRGDLCLVVGSVGSGKSAFLNAILREIDQVGGKFALRGPLSYASQNPWLMNRSVRENILMGKPYDPSFYKQVLEAAALTRDLTQMQQGDHTVVGERGSALSGGQRARISLARALYYREANIFLLDDVLSAVDTVVGNQLVEGIKRLLKDKVCILVTHQLQFVRFSTKVVLFEEGAMSFCGSYKELIKADHLPFVETLKAYDSLDESHPVLSAIEELREGGGAQSDSSSTSSSSSTSTIPLPNNMPIDDILDETALLEHLAWNELPIEDENILEDEEESAAPTAGFSVYCKFFQSSHLLWAALLLVAFSLAAQVMLVVFQAYVADTLETASNFTRCRREFFIAMSYLLIEVALFVISIYVLYLVSLRCAKALFNRMLRSVVRAPMHFYQHNPLGRILNRFSKDQTLLDESIYLQLSDAILLSFRTLLCFIAMLFLDFSLETLLVLAMIPIVAVLVWWNSRIFFHVSRDLKRIEAGTRAPLYSHLSTTLEGLPILRCFHVQSVFLGDFFRYCNRNTRALFTFQAVSRWYSFMVDFSCCSFFICYLFVTLTVLLIRKSRIASVAAVVQCVLYCQEIAELVQWTARLIAEVENGMTNVSRILQYTQLEQEAPAVLPADALLPVDWPSHGRITFNHMSIQYQGQPKPALADICCQFQPGEKVALVGRTGAGKSSFLSALFRIVEPTPKDGAIIVDGIDISTLGLTTLRQRLSIIPQDPFLFKGDVRFNLDPFGDHSDEDLWKALESVRLLPKVERMPGALSAAVLEGGQNFSVGQRQLLCLARAILRRRRIVVMDEATANIDLATSQQIQQTIQRIFTEYNVCTIAHRLHTVIDYHRILVLDAGRVVEFDTPHELLTTTDGYFATMVRELGPEGEAHLKEVARQCHVDRNSTNGIDH